MGVVLGIVGAAVTLSLIGLGLDVLIQKLTKEEVNKQEEN